MTNFFINLRNPRLLAAFGYDVFISALAFWLAVYLRFDTFQPVSFGSETIKTHFLLIQICLVISFLFNGLYQGLWRFSSLHDLMRVIRASGIALLSGLAINYFVGYANPLPRSIYLIHFVLVVMGLGGGRFLYRFIKDYGLRISPADMDSQRVLVIGAGTAGARIVRDIQSHPNMKLVVVGLIDDDQFKQGKKIHEVKVVGTTKDIPTISSDLRVDKIFVAIPTASSEDIKRIYDICEDLDIELKVLPKMDELFARETGVSMLRKLQIEDLLGRQQVQLDLQGLQGMLTGKVLLVSGAGGSIGSELCHQIAKFNPAKIIFYEVSEFFLYTLEQTFREKFPQIPFEPVIGDIRNRAKLELVFNKFKPQ
ncbi:MAG: polysaccharide biosynthesis protein, partial [Bdellovibrionota bacterium]